MINNIYWLGHILLTQPNAVYPDSGASHHFVMLWNAKLFTDDLGVKLLTKTVNKIYNHTLSV